MEEKKVNSAPDGQAEEEQLIEQAKIRRDKLQKLQSEGKNPYGHTKYEVTADSETLKGNFEAYEGKTVSMAGRMMSRRVMGKASFSHIADKSGSIQIYVTRQDIGEENYLSYKKDYDIGDIVGFKGFVFRTQTGEVTVHVTELVMLSKALLPLPEKYNGLQNQDLKYRLRHLDLIMNRDVRKTFETRSKILKEIRAYLDGQGYLEVDTPVLLTLEIGADARPFKTHHNALDIDMYMRIETELYLKRLIVGGMDRVYEVGRIFRNEGMDAFHNPEFTSIEMYQAYSDYFDMMDLIEDLYKTVTLKVAGTLDITYQGTEIHMGEWSRMTMAEAVKKYSGADYADWKSDADARAAAKEKGVELSHGENSTKGHVLIDFFDAFVEDKLVQPTIIYDYPVENSPLAKRKTEDPAFTERFEYFICGHEYGNAFSELNDPIDQKQRMLKQVEAKRAAGNKDAQVDEDFINALEYGLPPTGGLGMGLDRFVMLLTDSSTIRDVILFPTMKPVGADKKADVSPKKVRVLDETKIEVEPLFEEYVDFDSFAACDFRAVKIKACTEVPKSKKLLKFVLNDGSGTDRIILSGIHGYYEPEELVGKTAVAITNLPPRKMMGEESNGMLLSCINKYDGEEMLNFIMLDDQIPAGAKVY